MRPRASFLRQAREAIKDPSLQIALDNNAAQRKAAWNKAFASLPESAAVRQRGREIRQQTIKHLDEYLAQFVEKVQENGVQVHRAASAADAVGILLELARSHGVEMVAKAKSMVSEEIELNEALEAAGCRVVETDLGEYIVQLRGEKPTHIVTPAVHLRREDVGRTFATKLGIDYTTDVAVMNATAREGLREVFLSAQMGISGVNFGVAETGTMCIVTNEGNGRMVTILPPLHVALMGIERLVPTLDDLAVMLQILARSSTGQKMTSYVSLFNAPRQGDEPDGPGERHLILVDNGRRKLSEGDLAEALLCIRCGACLNACPVYQEVGGKTYNSVYPGPIGSLVSPGLFGVQDFGHLAKASTLCGACTDACPVQINFPKLLQRTRVKYVAEVPQPSYMTLGIKLYAWLMTSPSRLRWAQRAAAWTTRIVPRSSGWLRRLPPPLDGWTQWRHLPPFAARSFRARWNDRMSSDVQRERLRKSHPPADPTQPDVTARSDLLARFDQELTALGGELIPCTEGDVADLLRAKLQQLGTNHILASLEDSPQFSRIQKDLEAAGITLLDSYLPSSLEEREAPLRNMAQAEAGLTCALAAFADTGTLVQPSGAARSQLASLLPQVHLAILRSEDIYPTMADWLSAGGTNTIAGASNVVLVSGPSRTADIEMTLTIGVHGPQKVLVFCLA